jgi:serine/threonine-protein kinase HipA
MISKIIIERVMSDISVSVDGHEVGKLFYEKEKNQYGFNYTKNFKPISLIMPYKSATYIWKYKLHPIFDMHMPEGYLFEIFKKYITKEFGYMDDFLLFSQICSNIQSRLTYTSSNAKREFLSFDMDEVINNDTSDTFAKLVTTFLNKNAISGVQPKSLAILKDKENISSKEYIIKTWGEEYPELALNEYFCLRAIECCGVVIPKIKLSSNNKFLIVERFTYSQQSDLFFGFEEVLALMGKNKDEKYSGSYEQIAKIIYTVTTDKECSLRAFYKVVVMNYLLKNGDAHLKNFGILYTNDFSRIWFAPAYDVVNTVVYYPKDKPALSMFGKKLWFGKKELVNFGIKSCYLRQHQALQIYEECLEALQISIDALKKYIETNENFRSIGQKMIDCWKLSLLGDTYKEMPSEITRNWS